MTGTPIEQRIRKYAFIHNCDLDEATRTVLIEVMSEINSARTTEGLYDKLFTDENNRPLVP